MGSNSSTDQVLFLGFERWKLSRLGAIFPNVERLTFPAAEAGPFWDPSVGELWRVFRQVSGHPHSILFFVFCIVLCLLFLQLCQTIANFKSKKRKYYLRDVFCQIMH